MCRTTGPDSGTSARAGSAAASAEGYTHGTASRPMAFHGYHFRILTAQGPHAAGGAHDYLANGRMIGGFAVIALPTLVARIQRRRLALMAGPTIPSATPLP